MTLISPRMARSKLSGCLMLCSECMLIFKTEQTSDLLDDSSSDFEGSPYVEFVCFPSVCL